MDFTAENNFFGDDELQFDQHRSGRPPIVDWNGIIDSNMWFFLPNSLRSESAIVNDNRPSPPTRFLCDGYKFTMKKTTHPETGEAGLGIKCSLYPDDV